VQSVEADGIVASPHAVLRRLGKKTLTFDLFDRNDAIALTGQWRATAWRRWRP
jgi:hypothetical protein